VPLLLALVLIGLVLLSELWPLGLHALREFHILEKITLIVILTLAAQQW